MLLKEVYNQNFLEQLTKIIARHDKKFDAKNFLQIPQSTWESLELKGRMRFISLRLGEFLSHKTYVEQIEILKKTAAEFPRSKNASLALIVLPDFVEMFGSVDFVASMNALEFLTEFGTSEFAVRKFIKFDQKSALKFFAKWAKSKNHHIRRLASEGCRSRLPWGCALEEFKKNPQPILPILEQLKFDESEYVRKSVANNLNDISKDNPKIVLAILSNWRGEGVSEKLIKHALRTLLKNGDKAALALVGIDHAKSSKHFLIENFSLQKAVVKNSGELLFDFVLHNEKSNLIRLEYAVYFLRNNGSHSKKIFQITTKNFTKGVFNFSKKHSFREISTRKYYRGLHLISLVVNGIELSQLQFELV